VIVFFETVGAANVAAAPKPITFKFAIIDDESSSHYRGAKKISLEMAAAIKTQINIEIANSGALSGECDTVEIAMSCVIDITTADNFVLTTGFMCCMS
jgi:TRAP-type C4-dicarboxylate transport system substrate-binding protein